MLVASPSSGASGPPVLPAASASPITQVARDDMPITQVARDDVDDDGAPICRPDDDDDDDDGGGSGSGGGGSGGGVRAQPPPPGFFEKLCGCFGRRRRDGERGDSLAARGRGGGGGAAAAAAAGGSGSGAYAGVPLLPPVSPALAGRKCLVLDLDETLVHSSFKPTATADFVIPVEIENQVLQVYVAKRPGADYFLARMAQVYELVVFTASLDRYANPVLDLLDKDRVISYRLYREDCSFWRGNYVKDLSRLGRPLHSTIIVDNSPPSFAFHPDNAVAIGSWFDDVNDRELYDLIPFLEDLANVDDVCAVLDSAQAW